MSPTLTAGDLTIHRLIEQETTFLPAQDLFPGLTADVLAENRAWMKQAKAIDDNDVLILCFQSYIVKTPHHTILIDSCIGNDKPRPTRPKWNMKTDDTYMRSLKAAGISVDDIDYVMCTHLHVDHVGWNTRLENGRWVPTFPKARYVFAKDEYDYWTEQHAKAEVPAFGDSVLPIVEAKKAEIVGHDVDDIGRRGSGLGEGKFRGGEGGGGGESSNCLSAGGQERHGQSPQSGRQVQSG